MGQNRQRLDGGLTRRSTALPFILRPSPLCLSTPLFVAKGANRVDLRRAARRQPRGNQRDRSECRGRSREDRDSRNRPAEATIPIITPAIVQRAAVETISRTTPAGVAPSAILMLISRLRSATRKEISP